MPDHRPTDDPAEPGRGTWFWVLPAATFLVGILLGGFVIALTGTGAGQDAASGTDGAPAPTASSTTPTSRPAVTVTVPGQCLQLADDSEHLVGLVNQAATAARDLDAARLAEIVRQLQESQSSLSTNASACRGVATGSASPSVT